MDEATHKTWWPLHLRAALGETLTADEQANYELGLRQMETEEEQALSGSVENLKKTRQKNLELKSEYNRLRLQIEEIETQIAILEEHLAVPTKQLLGVGN